MVTHTMLRCAVFSFFLSVASCCERLHGIMSCDRLPETLSRMDGINILIVRSTLRSSIDLRQFALDKVRIQWTEMTCGNVKTDLHTQVFLGDKLFPAVSNQLLFTKFLIYKNFACIILLILILLIVRQLQTFKDSRHSKPWWKLPQ